MRMQAAQDFVALVVKQPALLSASPFTLFIGSNYFSGCLGQVLTDVVEIQQIRALLAEIVAKLIHNPRRTVAQPMYVGFVIQACFDCHLSPHPSSGFSCPEG